MTRVDVKVCDDAVPEELREAVWDYINDQVWYATYKPVAKFMTTYVPSKEFFMKTTHRGLTMRQPSMWMHRACFASDEHGLKKDHPVLWKLWETINQSLGNKYVIEGSPEDMSVIPDDNPNWTAPPTKDSSLEQGWRVYVNGQLDETLKHSHGVHRDTIDLTDDQTRTILYVANLKWFPTWFGECIFYPDDTEGSTGDHQQYQKMYGLGQGRNFKVDWPDDGKIVASVPGRIIDYDGRTLHTTRPAAIWAPDIRKTIVFRAKLKADNQL